MFREIEALILPSLCDATCYRLRPVADAECELTGILLEFRELVSISRATGEVTLIVMAID